MNARPVLLQQNNVNKIKTSKNNNHFPTMVYINNQLIDFDIISIWFCAWFVHVYVHVCYRPKFGPEMTRLIGNGANTPNPTLVAVAGEPSTVDHNCKSPTINKIKIQFYINYTYTSTSTYI
jgi:hypothetical protein